MFLLRTPTVLFLQRDFVNNNKNCLIHQTNLHRIDAKHPPLIKNWKSQAIAVTHCHVFMSSGDAENVSTSEFGHMLCSCGVL